MLEDTFLLVEAKQDLGPGALVQTNLVAVPCVNAVRAVAADALEYTLTSQSS